MNANVARLTVLLRTVAFAQRDAADRWVQGSGLTRQQAFTLNFIANNQGRGIIAREIAEMSGTTPASVTSLLKGLEARGLIRRTPSPDDSRVKLITVTPAGKREVAQLGDALGAAQEPIFAALDDDEQATLIGLLERIAAGIELPERHGRDGPPPFDARG